jgi:hypothetical protein
MVDRDEASYVWCFISRHAAHRMLLLHRAALRFFEVMPRKRYIAYCNGAFPAGVRWLRLLGFQENGESAVMAEDLSEQLVFVRDT